MSRIFVSSSYFINVSKLTTHQNQRDYKLKVRPREKVFVSTTLTRLTSKVTVNTTNITTDDEFTAHFTTTVVTRRGPQSRSRQETMYADLAYVFPPCRSQRDERSFMSRRDRFHARVPVGCICTRYTTALVSFSNRGRPRGD